MADIDLILETHSLMDFLPYQPRKIGEGRYRGRCPLCDSSDGLSVFKHEKGHYVFNCFSCNERGCVIDLFSKLNRVSIRKAIVALAPSENAPPISVQTRIDKSFDAYVSCQGKFVLCCVRCPSKIELKDDLEASLALVMAGRAQNWEVAPDGIAAVCPKCLSDANRETRPAGRGKQDSHRSFNYPENGGIEGGMS